MNWLKLQQSLDAHCPLKLIQLFWLRTNDFLPSRPVEGAECRIIDPVDLTQLAKVPELMLNYGRMVESASIGNTVIGIFIRGKLVGYTLFESNNVEIQTSIFDSHESNLSICLPPGVRYLSHGFVIPEARGQRLHSAMVRFAINYFGIDTVQTLTSSSNIWNTPYRRSLKSQGFDRVGKAVSLQLLFKPLVIAPKNIDSNSGASVKSADVNQYTDIVLHRAEGLCR